MINPIILLECKNLIRMCAVLLVAISGAGCSLTPATPFTAEYHFNIVDCQPPMGTAQPHDRRAYDCATKLDETLRQRFNNARFARSGGGFVQVLTAGISSLFTGLGGANGLTAGTILSAVSAMMPQLGDVFEAKDRAEAYADGMQSIGIAIGTYLMTLAESQDGKINTTRLTTAGASLLDKAIGTRNVVQHRLAGLLPTTEDLRKSRGEFEKAERLSIIPKNDISFLPITVDKNQQPVEVQITNGVPTTASTSNAPVASVELTSSGNKAKIKVGTEEYGRATITIGTNSGASGTVFVRVEKQSFEIDKKAVNLSLKSNTPEKVTAAKGGDFESWTSSDPATVEVKSAGRGTEVNIFAKTLGAAVVTLTNKAGREAKVEVTVSD